MNQATISILVNQIPALVSLYMEMKEPAMTEAEVTKKVLASEKFARLVNEQVQAQK